MTIDSFFPFRAPLLESPPFGSPSARPGFFWGQGRLEYSHSCSRRAGYVGERFCVFHLVFLQRLLNLVSFLQNWSFWTLFPFLLFGRQDGFFRVIQRKGFFPSEFSLNTPFMVDVSFCLERRKPGRFFLLDVQPQQLLPGFPRCQFDIFEHKALSIMLWQS